MIMKDRNCILTDETIGINEHTLHRIRCVKAFADVKEGELGGFVESKANLFGNAWVYNEAKVFGCAQVYGNAHVFSSACV